MATTIKCSKCGSEIEITEALKKELEEKILAQVEQRHHEEIQKIKEETLAFARKEAIEKIRKEYDNKITLVKQEIEEKDRENRELMQQAKTLISELSKLKSEKERMELEYQKKLLEEEGKIREETRKKIEEELSFKLAEKDKKLLDAEMQIKELQRKLEQGSQQLQGEIQELTLEMLLKKEFPQDEIREVPKGTRGADIVQIIKTNTTNTCGTIIWESKNTKNWDKSWLPKLKDDQRRLKADIAVIVSRVLPENIKSFGFSDGVWMCDIHSVIGLAHALRQQIVQVYRARAVNNDRAEKAEIVYNYLTSNEFKQRIEVLVEYFKDRREKLEKEKAYFLKKWQEEEKSIGRIIESAAGIYGDLQGLVGSALPKISYFELTDGKNNSE